MKRILMASALTLLALIVLGVVGLYFYAQVAEPRIPLGVQNGRLAPCSLTPNCVSTQSERNDSLHFAEPIPFTVSAVEAKTRLLAVLRTQPRLTILREEANYVHALSRSPTMGYPDDNEFYLDEAAKLIHFRAAARVGGGDQGVNRRRMGQIRTALQPLLNKP